MKQDKVLGALLAAAIGDAMGAPLDSLPVYLISGSAEGASSSGTIRRPRRERLPRS